MGLLFLVQKSGLGFSFDMYTISLLSSILYKGHLQKSIIPACYSHTAQLLQTVNCLFPHQHKLLPWKQQCPCWSLGLFEASDVHAHFICVSNRTDPCLPDYDGRRGEKAAIILPLPVKWSPGKYICLQSCHWRIQRQESNGGSKVRVCSDIKNRILCFTPCTATNFTY